MCGAEPRLSRLARRRQASLVRQGGDDPASRHGSRQPLRPRQLIAARKLQSNKSEGKAGVYQSPMLLRPGGIGLDHAPMRDAVDDAEPQQQQAVPCSGSSSSGSSSGKLAMPNATSAPW